MLRYQLQQSRSAVFIGAWELAFMRNGDRLWDWRVGKESEDQTWREYSLECVYHGCAAPQASLGVALNGFDGAKAWNYCESWAKTMGANEVKEADWQ
jgi:hypothetical protein